MAKKKHHKFSHTHMEHHKDGSHTIHHQREDGADKDVKHAAADLNAAHDSVEDHLGAPNAGEAEANAGDHGVPEAQAAPAGLSAPAAAAPAGIPGQGA